MLALALPLVLSNEAAPLLPPLGKYNILTFPNALTSVMLEQFFNFKLICLFDFSTELLKILRNS